MAQKITSSNLQLSLDLTDTEPEKEQDITVEFLKQNEMIAQEIWKYDKSLYCPTTTFKFFAFFYAIGLFAFIYSCIYDGWKGTIAFLPKPLFYLHSILTAFLLFVSMWACFIIWRVIYSKDPERLHKPIFVFKLYVCFVFGFEIPIYAYYMTQTGWAKG